MIKNYFKTAFRNLWRHKAFSLINIAGLAVGMSVFFLISLYIRFEYNYDKFNEKSDRIYRLVTDMQTSSGTLNLAPSSSPMAPYVRSYFPEVVAATRICFGSAVLQRAEMKFQEDALLYADSNICSVFTLPFIMGDPAKALIPPFAVVLSETSAKKYFGKANPMGQSLTMDGLHVLTVTGVMKDMPANAHFRTDILVSMATYQYFHRDMNQVWGNFGWYTYLLLPQGYDPARLVAKFPAFVDKYIGAESKQQHITYTLLLEPLTDIYLRSKRLLRPGDYIASGSLSNIYIISVIEAILLIIACINFINLTTARAAERAKEVGVRKVMGAGRDQLNVQFLSESILLCLLAFLLSVGFTFLLYGKFNELCGKLIISNAFSHPGYWFFLFIVALLIGVIAGIYPALILSGFNPALVLKGRFSSGNRGVFLRKALVVTQFTISVFFISATIIVFLQLRYMRTQPLGFNKSQMLVVDFRYDSTVRNNYRTVKQEMTAVPNVLSASFSSGVPGGSDQGAFTEIENASGQNQNAGLDLYSTDYDFLSQYDIKVIAGRAFSSTLASDSTQALMINEAAVKAFGYSSPEQAVGKHFSQWGRTGKIIGVVKDFHFKSLQELVKPLTLRIDPTITTILTLNINTANLSSTLSQLEKRWNRLSPRQPFNYYFLDEAFDKQYGSEERFGNLFLYASILTIIISCLGLLALASYSTIQRSREISIRKVLGASVSVITMLVARDFVRLVLWAIIIATPVSWWLMNKWLHDYPYRININLWVFVASGILAFLIALVTVSFHAIKAALANPVKGMKIE